MNRRRGYNSIQKNLKDYMVPIVGGVLVLILIISLFFGGGDKKQNNQNVENRVGLNVLLDSTNSDAMIIYPGDYRTQIEGNISLYRGERVLVREGTVTITGDDGINFKVNKLGELRYQENGNYSLSSGDVWINTVNPIDLDMTFAKLKIGGDTNISLSQNEMGSTIYLVSGFVEVSNLVGRNTVLADGQRLTVSRGDASSATVDLSLGKQNLDEFFLRSDWFILNRGNTFLNKNSTEEENEDGEEGTNLLPSSSLNNNSLISFNSLIDESNVSAGNISISGSYLDEDISKISVNGVNATLNKVEKTFRFDSVDTSKRENDLVFKVYDDSNSIVSKFVYTVYYSGGSTGAGTTTGTSSSSGFNVTTFNVDGTQFKFTSPTTSNTYTTTETFVTIRGEVTAEGIDRVTVNGFQLSSFNGSTWRYHADVTYNNLSEGTNIYEINYYSGTNLVYTNYFTIIKRTAGDNNTAGVISSEATLN